MVIDVLVVLVFLAAFYVGFVRGIIGTVFMVAAAILGLVVGLQFTPIVTAFLRTSFADNMNMLPIISFFLLFLGSIFLVRLVARGLEEGLKTSNINFLSKVLGGLLVGGLAIFLFSVLVSFFDRAGLVPDVLKSTSKTYVYVRNLPEEGFVLLEDVVPYLKKTWDSFMALFDNLKQ